MICAEAPQLTVHELREFATPTHALGTIQPGDGVWITCYAILMSLAEDLADARHHGFWKDDPSEMWEKSGWMKNKVTKSGNISIRKLVREFYSQPITDLMHVIRGASNGKVKVGRGNLIRMAKAHVRKWKHNDNDVVRKSPAIGVQITLSTSRERAAFLHNQPLGKPALVDSSASLTTWHKMARYHGYNIKIKGRTDGLFQITRIK